MADVKYLVETILNVRTQGGKKASAFADSIVKSGNKIQSLGAKTSASLFSMRTAFAAVAGVYGVGRLIKGAIDANREIENLNFGIATTLQLFKRNDRGDGGTAMFNRNLQEAAMATDKLFRIAATSPASFQQAQDLFKNVMPGLAQVEGSMDKMLDFTKSSLSVGTLLGGDFAQAGRDLRRILTGQAGMDVRAWTEGLGTAVHGAAQSLGGEFEKLGALSGDHFVKEFNTMDPQKRYTLVKEAIKDLGVATEAAGATWDGLTSALSSDAFLLSKAFGFSLFEGLRPQLQKLMGPGGIGNPLSKSFVQLETSARVAGMFMADAGSWVFDRIVGGAEYLSSNWLTVVEKLSWAFDKGIKAAKLFLAMRATAMVAGAGAKAAGGGFKAAQGLTGFVKGFFIKGLWDNAAQRFRTSSGQFVVGGSAMAMSIKSATLALGGLVPAFGLILPIVLLLGAALLGVGVAFAGVAAYFIDNWDTILSALNSGVVSIGPLADAFGHLWAKLLALGEVIVGTGGTSSATDTMTRAILFATEVVYGMIGAMAFFLRAAGAVQFAWNVITMGLKAIAGGFVAVVMGILALINSLNSVLGLQTSGIEAMLADMNVTMGNLTNSAAQDARDATQLLSAADTFEAAYDTGSEFSKTFEDRFKKALASAASQEGEFGGKPPISPSKNITIHNLRVEQDLRNQDPDRIMGAFIRKLEKTVSNPTQALTHEDYGV